MPRTFKEIVAVSTVSKKEIGRCFKLILKAHDTNVDIITTGDFMHRWDKEKENCMYSFYSPLEPHLIIFFSLKVLRHPWPAQGGPEGRDAHCQGCAGPGHCARPQSHLGRGRRHLHGLAGIGGQEEPGILCLPPSFFPSDSFG